MKDKSKILGVLNTGKRHSQQKEAAGVVKQIVSGGGAMNVDLSDYLLKSVWDSVFEIRIDSKGETYIFGKLPVVTQYGITMYGEGGDVNIPSIYAGLPIDNNTLVRDANGILMVNPDIELGGGLDTEELEEFLRTKNYATESWVTGKNYVNTTTLANELKKYVTLNDDETINGLKNFTKGIQINGLGITNTQDDVIYIDANLVVRGGITMYATDTVDIPSLLDSIPVASNSAKGLASFDATYFSVDNGHVTLLPDNVGLNEEELAAYLDDKKYATQSWVQSLKYATSTELDLLEDKVNDFLSGSDTDTIINKWKELESFLSGLSESDNLATILGTKANQTDLDSTNKTLATKWTQNDTKISNWDTAYSWGNHASVGYALKTYVDSTFVTFLKDETISGIKTFTNGIKIGTSAMAIKQSQDDVVYIDANLVVRGGITMYADGTVDVGTIYDGLPIDGVTIYWEGTGNNKVLKAKFTDGALTEITSDMVIDALGYTPYDASNPNGYISGITSAMVVSALGYTPLKDHQPIYTLTIQKNGTTLGTYTPNNEDATIDIIVPTKVSELSNDSSYATTTQLNSNVSTLNSSISTKADKTITISAGTGLTGGGTLAANRTLSLATSGVSAGTYKSVTVDAYGRVTSGTNPTTLSGYGITDAYTKNDITTLLGNYVTLAGTQTITGEKNFTGGLKVNGSPIVYDATNKYWKLEGDLLVTGGVTMYGNDSEFTPSTIMDAIVADNTSLKVIDGVLTFVGGTGGGLTEVHWDDVIGKPTLLSSFTDDVVAGHYLNLAGGQMIGNIGYSITPDDYDIGIPAAGTLENSQVLTGSDFSKYKSFIGTYTGSSGWNLALSIRHRNGGGHDGANYGLYITSPLFGASANLVWNRQYGGASTSWQGERVILDSHNWAQYVTALDGGNYLPIDGGTLYGVLRIFASRTSDYSIVYLGGLHNIDNYSPTSGRGARFVVVNTSTNTAIGCLGLASTGVPYWSPTTAGVTHPLLYAGGDFQAVGDKPWALIVRSKNYHTSISAAHVDGYGFYIGSHVNDNSKYLLNCRYAVSSSLPNGYHAFSITNNGNVDANGTIHSQYATYKTYTSSPGTNTGLARIGTFDRYNGGMVIQFGAGAKDWRKAFNIIDEGWTISLLSLDSSGNLTVNGGITMYSDIRKKTKLQDVELSLSQIADAPLIEHYYNSDTQKTTHVGSIAQYWAGLNDWFCKQDQDGFYTMEIQNAALASAISVARHLQKYESKTDKKIRMLKKRICELEDEMEKLKSK